jgi:3-phytase
VSGAAGRWVARAVALGLAAALPGCGGGDADRPPRDRTAALASTLAPFAETPDLVAGKGDDADDVAIHPSGYVIGTSKNRRGGLEVYDTDGRRVQWLPLGETNNVDLRGDLVVSSNRGRERIDVLAFRRGRVRLVRSIPVPFEPYGICMVGDTVVVTAGGTGRVEQYTLAGRRLRRLTGIAGQAEGCVADDAGNALYVGEEDRGIWRFPADPRGSRAGRLIDTVEGNLSADVEGLTFVRGRLIASSQGDSTFAVYRKDRLVATFRVVDGNGIDGASKTDGVDASAAVDLLVVHDNDNPGGESSNYKLVRLSALFGR